ncbi:RcnB family protein [Phenylobacterium sp.]|jgi:Ni/Co efflux regulator RcnB|uniref:RcnB family protein n=1 Tax=Phenylobacterium sp. TaxID=1871053 RepID=UPI002E31094A|nr:RcnB family protein [Phenylobacterium sp.]HEX4711532.1 RcnB family protein [Phenylobacterium sp.]
MRRLISVLAAAALAATPLAAAGVAMAKDHEGGRPEQRGPGGDGRWQGGGHGGGEERGGGREYRGGEDRGGGRWERAEPRSGQRYDPRAYAPPRGSYPAPPHRGGYLGPQAGGQVIQDYGRFRLRAPPRGYEWVRVPGGMALVSTMTGQVFDVVPY